VSASAKGVNVPLSTLRYTLVSAEQQAGKLSTTEQRIDFLSQKLNLGLDCFGPYLQGISRQQLLNGHISAHRPPTFGLLKDLHSFKKREQGSTYKDMSQWWLHLTGISIQEKKLKKEIEKVQRKIVRLQPNAARQPKVKKELDFLDSCAFSSGQSFSTVVTDSTLDVQATSSSANTESERILFPPSSNQVTEESLSLVKQHPISLKLAEGAAQLAAARRKEEELLNELSELKLKYNTAAETNRQHFLEFQLQSTEIKPSIKP